MGCFRVVGGEGLESQLFLTGVSHSLLKMFPDCQSASVLLLLLWLRCCGGLVCKVFCHYLLVCQEKPALFLSHVGNKGAQFIFSKVEA